MKILTLLSLLFYSAITWGQNVNISAQLYNHSGDYFLAIDFQHADHWHTYWKNPGDAGMPPEIVFRYGDQIEKVESLEWPYPQQMKQEGNLLAYGYSGKNSFFYYLPAAQWKKLETTGFKVEAKWLACNDICVPESSSFNIQKIANQIIVSNKEPQQANFTFSQSTLDEIFNKIPHDKPIPHNLEIYLTVDPGNNDLLLHYSFKSIEHVQLPHKLGLLTPFPRLPFAYHREELFYQDNVLHGITSIKWEGEFEDPPLKLPESGLCRKPWELKFLIQDPLTGNINIIKKVIHKFNTTGIETTKAFYRTLKPYIPTHQNSDSNPTQHGNKDSSNKASTPAGSLLFYLFFAFIGGLILNVMPCVLPVISIKLFGLIQYSNKSRGEILKHNLFYSLGVLLSFLVLAITVHILKSTGEEIGWGFQLQSPLFVAIVSIILFVFAINLFGLFEFSTPGGSKLGGIQLKDGPLSDMFSGVLATILSTPCSAPFLGTALTFAFTTSIATLYLIFLFIGLGLSFPFIMTGFFPAALKILPKPGMWMEKVKKFLALSLILTLVWLLDVFVALSSTDALFNLNITLAMVFFALFFWHKISKSKFWRTVIVGLTLLTLIPLYNSLSTAAPTTTVNGNQVMQIHDLSWEKWSPEKMNHPGKLTFVDFTAKWCFTCKANEKAVIHTDDFKKLVQKYDVKLLLADWTKRDAVIGNWLKEHGYAGVPVYFVISAQGDVEALGETITIDKIEMAIKKTKKATP